MDISKIREEESNKKIELKENHTSLKDAIANAMNAQKTRVEKIEIKEEIKKELSEDKNILEEIKEIKRGIHNSERISHLELERQEIITKNEEKEEAIKEVSEKILRDLVDEE